MDHTYAITGMSCGKCLAKVADVLKTFDPQATATLTPPRAMLHGVHDTAQINAALAQVGAYAIEPVVEKTPVKPTCFTAWFKTYYPLLLIVTLISLVSLRGASTVDDWMLHFMAGFFIVFGFFKLLDIRGFRDAYRGYDLLAKRWGAYGLIYPFIELALGFAFLFRVELHAALWTSIIVMGFGAIGVIQAVVNKRAIRCACLGTVLNLPMSTITIVENLGMVAMSVWMLWAM